MQPVVLREVFKASRDWPLNTKIRRDTPPGGVSDTRLRGEPNMESESQIIWGMIFGAIGLGFFVYGKRQKAVVPLLVGIALFVVPYLVANVYVLVAAGAVLVALPYFVRL